MQFTFKYVEIEINLRIFVESIQTVSSMYIILENKV